MATWRLAAADPLLAAVVLPLVVLVNVFAGFAWSLVITLTETKVSSALTDPLTGLYNRAGFDDRMSTLLGARDRSHHQYLVLAVIGVDNHGLLMSLGQHTRAERAVITATRQLRAACAATPCCPTAATATSCSPNRSPPPTRRHAGTSARHAHRSPRPTLRQHRRRQHPTGSAGAHPVNDVLDELLHLADHARHDAHRAGGNTARTTINPTLTILDDPTDAS